jgi:hypothetical protein
MMGELNKKVKQVDSLVEMEKIMTNNRRVSVSVGLFIIMILLLSMVLPSNASEQDADYKFNNVQHDQVPKYYVKTGNDDVYSYKDQGGETFYRVYGMLDLEMPKTIDVEPDNSVESQSTSSSIEDPSVDNLEEAGWYNADEKGNLIAPYEMLDQTVEANNALTEEDSNEVNSDRLDVGTKSVAKSKVVEATRKTKEAASDGWTKWTGGHHTVNFTLNNHMAQATVGWPGDPVKPTNYFVNGNQFGVYLLMDANNNNTFDTNEAYPYTFNNGNSESSGEFFAIEGNGDASPYVLQPSSPSLGGGPESSNPMKNCVASDYEYFYQGNKVKQTTTIELNSGEILDFVEIVEFKNNGIFYSSSFTNSGEHDIPGFRIISKIDTMLNNNDSVPLYYGEKKHNYYLKDGSLRLKVSGVSGFTGSTAGRHQRLWTDGFTDTYRNYNTTVMEKDVTANSLAYQEYWPDGDSEIIYDQRSHTLAVGETSSMTWAVNILLGETVTAEYIDEEGNQMAEDEVLEGFLNDPYETESKAIEGYELIEPPSNATGFFTNEPQLVTYVYKKVIKEEEPPKEEHITPEAIDPKDEEPVLGEEAVPEDKNSVLGEESTPKEDSIPVEESTVLGEEAKTADGMNLAILILLIILTPCVAILLYIISKKSFWSNRRI